MLHKVLRASDLQIREIILKKIPSSKEGLGFIFMKGENDLLFQAHIDTLRNDKNEVLLSEKNKIIRNKKGILGADDRAGVFALLLLYQICEQKKLKMPSFLFTDGEESGGIGMCDFCNQITSELNGCKLIIAIDRRGCGEYVTYSDISPKVENYIKSFGFNENYGTFSDCVFLTMDTDIPSVNVSAGFHNEHSPNETLHVDELILTIRRLVEVIQNPIKSLYKVCETKYFSGKIRQRGFAEKLWYGHSYWEDDTDMISSNYEELVNCYICDTFSKGNIVPPIDGVSSTKMVHVCDACLTEYGDDFGWEKQTKLLLP